MNKAEKLAALFAGITVLILMAMCSVVTAAYCAMKYAALYEGASASAGIAFLWIIPFAVCALSTVLSSVYFLKKSRTPMPIETDIN